MAADHQATIVQRRSIGSRPEEKGCPMSLSRLLVGVTLAVFTMTGFTMTVSARNADPMPPARSKTEAGAAARGGGFRKKRGGQTRFTVAPPGHSPKILVGV